MKKEFIKKYDKACNYAQALYDELLNYRHEKTMLMNWLDEKTTKNTKNVISVKLVEIMRKIDDLHGKHSQLFNIYNNALYDFKRARTEKQKNEENKRLALINIFLDYMDSTYPDYNKEEELEV